MPRAALICVIGLAIRWVSAHCEGPPQVTGASSNVTGSPPYPSGTVLRYHCNIGYTTSGTSRFFTCSDNKWSGGNIQCDEILCSYIPPPTNGKIVNSPTRQIGTLIIFECNIGHVMSGASSSMCRTDGLWSPSNIPPSCSAKSCGEFGSVQYGDTFQDSSYTERNKYGAVVKVTCNSGYQVNGPSDVTCQADGTWSTKPTCEKSTCPPYPNINSTCISRIQKFGTYIFIQCKEGENVSVTKGTSDYAECQDNGQWSNLDMACYCDCFLGGPLTNITFKNLNSKGFLPHDQTLQWTCLAGLNQNEVVVQCKHGQLKIYVEGKLFPIENHRFVSFKALKDLAAQEMCKSELENDDGEIESDSNTSNVLLTLTASVYPTTELITAKHSNTTNLEPSQGTTEKNFLKTDEQSRPTSNFSLPTTLAGSYTGSYDSTIATYRNTENVSFTNTSVQSTDTTRLSSSSDETIIQPTTSQEQLQDTVIQPTTSRAQLQDTVIQSTTSQAQLQDTVIQSTTSRAQIQDTVIQSTTSQEQLQETVIQSTTSRAQLQDTVIQLTKSRAQLQDTVIQSTTSQAQLQDTVIQSTTSRAQLQDTVIQSTTSQAQLQDTVIQSTTSQAQIQEAVIQSTTSREQLQETVIQSTTNQAQLQETVIQSTTSREQLQDTVIQSTTSQEQLHDTTEKNFSETDELSRMTNNNYTTGTTVSSGYIGTYDENTETGTTISGGYIGTYDENTETGTTVSGGYIGTYDENTETGTTVSGGYIGTYDENTETGTTISGGYIGTYDENTETGTTVSGGYIGTYDENTETGTTVSGRYTGTYDDNTETNIDTDVTNKSVVQQHTDMTSLSTSPSGIQSTTTSFEKVKETTEYLTHCEGPPQVTGASSNVTGSPPYPSGTVLRYDCNIGYTTSGTSRFFTCSGNVWTGGNIQCDEILCSYIPPPTYGKIVNSPTRQIGTLIIFVCNIGHVMSGASSSVCRANGLWSPSNIPPSCSAKSCGEFGFVQYGDTFQDSSYTEQNKYGAVVKVTCNRGYQLNGPSDVTCQADGTWGTKPTCEKITCPPYPNINSTCISRIQKFGTYIYFQCKEGENVSVTKGTSDYAVCQDNGQWSNLDMACYCDCFLGGPLTNITFKNLNSKGFLPHDQTLQWTCLAGLKQNGVDIQCINGQLKINVGGCSLLIEINTLKSFEDIIDIAMKEMCKLEQITDGARSELDSNTTKVSRKKISSAINYNCSSFSKSSTIGGISSYYASIMLICFNSVLVLIKMLA